MQKTKIILKLLACFFIIQVVSCKNKKQNYSTKRSTLKSFDINNEFAYLDNINDPNYLVSLLDNSTELEGERVGYERKQSSSYPIYKRLCDIASDTTLLRLTKHKNPKIRVYGMWALTNKNRGLALTQMKYLKDDKETVNYTTGCVMMAEKVSWLTASKFDSTEVIMLPKKNLKYLDYDIVIK